jgi:hypothetical protein
MDYQKKYLKYKKKYSELKSKHKMEGGVNPESFMEKKNQRQQPILLKFKELSKFKELLIKELKKIEEDPDEDPNKVYFKLFMKDLDKCIEISNSKLSGGGIESIIKNIEKKISENKLTEDELNTFNKLNVSYEFKKDTRLKSNFGKLLNLINNRIKDSTQQQPKQPTQPKQPKKEHVQRVITIDEPTSDDNIYHKLKYIIEAKNIKVSISMSLQPFSSEPIFLININSSNDNLLLKLGKDYDFPRGFPIIWIPNKLIKMYGFYPKFENDDKRGDNVIKKESINDLEQIVKITMFKKWSGYLGQLCVFNYNGRDYWTVTSKKTSTNLFSHDGIRLFKKFITPELVDYLIVNNLHICAEMLSFNDQSHGYQLKNESPIVTMIAEGNLCDIFNRRIKGNVKQFITPYQISKIVDICNIFNLPCDTGIIIEGNKNIMNFIESLEKFRDFMTDSMFESIIKKKEGITLKKGNITHTSIAGDALEGLVLRLEYNNTNSKKIRPSTIKYKFPIYTIRTMLIRLLFQKASENNIDFITYVENPSGIQIIDDYFKRWIGPSGKIYWKLYIDKCIEVYKTSEFKKKLLYYKNCYNLKIEENQVSSGIKCISPHIILADEALKKVGYPGDFIGSIESIKPTEPIKQTEPIIIGFFGSVGSGKSTAMNKFCEFANSQYENKFIPIDGDTMDLDNLDAMNFLGSEKNDYLNYLIVRQIIFGNVPVVSHGSFVFTKICDYVEEVIGIKPKLLLCEMIHNNSNSYSDDGGGGSKEDDGGGSKDNGVITITKLDQFINWTVDNVDIYKKATKDALLQRYGQSIKEFNELKNISGWLFQDNRTYNDSKKQELEINNIITRLFKIPNPKFDPISILNSNDEIIKYGCDLVNYSPSLKIDFKILFNDVKILINNVREIEPNKVKFKQLRYLVKYWDTNDKENPITTKTTVSFGHITLKYDKNGIELNKEIIGISKNFGHIKRCKLVPAISSDRKIISAIVLGKITENVEKYDGVEYLDFDGKEENPKYVHVTVSSGIHQPNLMNHFSKLYLEGNKSVEMKYKNTEPPIEYYYKAPKDYCIKYYKPYYV